MPSSKAQTAPAADSATVETPPVEVAPEAIETAAPTTVEEMQAVVSLIRASEPADRAPNTRSYTKRDGFRSITALEELPIATLLGMGACINAALSQQVADGVEGAEEALNLIAEHAGSAVTATANEVQFFKFLGMAVDLGYGEDHGISSGSDINDIELPERDICVAIVDAFLASQPKVRENSWAEWLKANG